MKKIKNWYIKRNEQGSSLLEVIVAVVILAVVGTTLLGGLNSANLAQRKTAQVAFAENQMQMGNDALALTNFTACDSTTVNPYSSVSMPNNVTILSVGVLDPSTSAVTDCSAITTAAAKSAETVEQIKLQYTNSVTGITRTRTVLKYLQALTTNLSTDCKAAGYKINAVTPSNMQLVAGDYSASTNPLSTTCDGLGTDTVWDPATITGVGAATGVSAYVDSQNFLNLNSAASGSVAGTITVRVNAHDSLTGTAAIYNSMTVTLLPTISLQSGTTTTWTVLQGCGVMSQSRVACTTTSTRSFTLTGGARSNQSTWQAVTPTASNPWRLVPSGTSAVLSYDYTQTGYNGSSTLAFVATGGALQHPLNFGSINLVVRPNLQLSSVSVPTSSCNNKNFLATSSNYKCSITIGTVPGTGYIDTNGNGGATYTSTDTRGVQTVTYNSASTYMNYSSSTDSYSRSISFYKKATSGSLCYGKATNAQDTAVIGYVTDVITGTILPLTVTVTC